jgi:hypothetical protein
MGMMKPLRWIWVLCLALLFSGCAGMQAGKKQDSREKCDFAYIVTKDNADALQCCTLAAEQGDVAAQYRLGQMYARGEAGAKNPTLAVKWTKEAANKGHVGATKALANWYLTGRNGLAKNPGESARLLTLLVEGGDAEACFALGIQTVLGMGVAQDSTRAQILFLAAHTGGYPVPSEFLDIKKVSKIKAYRGTGVDADKETVRAVQKGLLKLGYKNIGKADGIAGKQTAKAVRQFQEERGLIVDGVVSVELMQIIEDELASKQ